MSLKKEYEELDDEELTSIGNFNRIYGRIYIIAFVVIFVAIVWWFTIGFAI